MGVVVVREVCLHEAWGPAIITGKRHVWKTTGGWNTCAVWCAEVSVRGGVGTCQQTQKDPWSHFSLYWVSEWETQTIFPGYKLPYTPKSSLPNSPLSPSSRTAFCVAERVQWHFALTSNFNFIRPAGACFWVCEKIGSAQTGSWDKVTLTDLWFCPWL